VLYHLVRWLAWRAFRLGFRARAVGLEHVPPRGALLLASNHVSVLDPPAVGASLVRPIHFLAKAELFKVPGLGWLIRRLNSHPVERDGADAGALRLAAGLLKAGQGLLVFPEGTRGDGLTLARGRAGVGMLAAMSGVPVVPVYVSGTAQALPKGAAWPRPARVRIAFGPALRFERERGKERYQSISDEIMAAIGRLKAEAEGGAPASVTRSDPTARGSVPAGQIQ
jgi:1-acyl-sn-glycerol-3-phosphate acyltransferase